MSTQGLEGGGLASRSSRPRVLDGLLLERLAETGFLASECGLDEQAEKILGALVKLRPGEASPRILLAIVLARGGRLDQAIDELGKVIVDHPDSEMAKAMLGTMLVHAQRPGALALFEDVLASGTDQDAANVVHSSIDLARQQEGQAASPGSETLEFFRHYNIRP